MGEWRLPKSRSEAPVLVVKESSKDYNVGGAGNPVIKPVKFGHTHISLWIPGSDIQAKKYVKY